MRFVKAVSSEPDYTPVSFVKELEECMKLYPDFTEAMKGYIAAYGKRKSSELRQAL